MRLILRFSKLAAFLGVLFLLSVAGQVLAQEEPITVAPELVTGSRLAESLDEVPQATYVITAEEIEKSGAKMLSEVLDKIPGISSLRRSSWSQDDSIVMRGAATEILVLVDGVPYYKPSHGADMFNVDLRSIPLESIERIEVVKGAGSALYGSMAAAGVINIITKTPDKYKTSIIAEGGSNDWRRYSAMAGIKGEVFDVGIRYNHREEGEVSIRYDSYLNRMLKALDYDEDSASVALSWGNWRFSADFGSYDSKWEPYKDAVDRHEDDYKRFYLKYADLKNEVIAYAHLIDRKYKGSYESNNYDEDVWGLEFTQRTSMGDIPLAWGIDYRFEDLSVDDLVIYANSFKAERYNIAPFVQFSFLLGDIFMDIGLRYENWNVDNGKDESEFAPKISFYHQDASGKLWYLTAGKSFAMPSLYQLYSKSSWHDPNPNLLPEKGWAYDFGIKDPVSKWNINLFYLEMDDKIKWETIDSEHFRGRYNNLAEFRSWGIEGQLEKPFTTNLSWINGMTWQKAEEKQTSSDPWRKGGTPQWELYSELNYDNGLWYGSLSAHYYGRREKDDYVGPADDDFVIVDALLSYNMKNDRITLAAYNIFDKEYIIDTFGFIGPERRVYLTLEHLF